MKKRYLALFVTPLLFGSLTSCSNKAKDCLTYGSAISQSINSLETLTTVELYNKAMNEEETFLLAVYQGSYSEEGCFCWPTFLNTIASYMNEYRNYVYLYDAQSQDDSIHDLKIDKFENSAPTLYIFKGKKQLAKYSYQNSRDQELFENSQVMHQKISKVVESAKLLFVDDAYLSNNLKEKQESVVIFIRKNCGDCSYVLPNVIIPYINSGKVSKKVYVYDIQSLYDLSKKEDATNDEKQVYQAIKDKYQLSFSSNNDFGYQQGVVPTIQYYNGNVLKDASVFFNDVVGQKDDGSFYIADSYYTNERLTKLSYLKDVNFTTVLKELTIEASNVLQTKSGSYYWSQQDAAKYHTPILKAFLNRYVR